MNNGSSGIIINDVADHFGTFYISSSNIEHKTSAQNEYRSYTSINVEIFKNLLDQTDFSNILQIPCPNEAYIQFMIQYKYAFEKAFPLKKSKIKNKNVKREPWFTSGLLTSSKNRTKLLTKKLQKPTERNILTYKNYNKLYNKTKRNMKVNYFSNILDENKHDIKNTWSILRSIIGKGGFTP